MESAVQAGVERFTDLVAQCDAATIASSCLNATCASGFTHLFRVGPLCMGRIEASAGRRRVAIIDLRKRKVPAPLLLNEGTPNSREVFLKSLNIHLRKAAFQLLEMELLRVVW